MYSDIYLTGNYNRKLTKLANLETAVYWAELIDIIPKVTKKKTFDEAGYFHLDRDYVEKQTSLDLETQLFCDEVLHNLGVVDVSETDPNSLRVRLDQMTAILIDEKVPKLPEKLKKKKSTTKSSKDAQVLTMKKHVGTDVAELVRPLQDWIDSIYANKKYLTFKIIDTFVSAVKKYTSDQSVQLKIIEIATIHAWQDAAWAISSYEKDYHSNKQSTVKQKEYSGVNEAISF